ncbi:hypothetical protein IWW34DRAFT_879511 [Fusarium oxysporum f. sp. albedinis]|jgi:hypothetical protein|nr:hypothetical protein FOWG_15118 [Fusarium oxysporum f. sp. lycopersici MN25]EXK25830.1 hypothetical protein FOMG_17530 [Fusarium oxysporum f. sp. melonis 26406]KAF5262285.1 hypothetical protein FOXYS1_7006 [Fusarium oxysporum]KAH7466201.1 hypothetical protein FOMA001_g15895 [Fusarium oxysporum f. sp. matthiolae]KAI3575865.1 hypothetical protein IWW34DRAFT_879511 [Fusarium oxysporum f. sp. albedinis]
MGNSGSILPWDDWIYHVDDLKNEANGLHDQATTLQDSIRAQVLQYNTLLGQTKQLMSGNAALVIIARAIKFSDQELKQFEAQLDAMPDPPEGSVPAKFGSFLTELTGSALVLKAIVNIGKLAKNAIFESMGEGAGEAAELGIEGLAEAGAELGVEAGVEVGAEAALADTGIGIIAAVGLDVIFGAINGARERDQLQAQIDKLNDALNKLKSFQYDLNTKFNQLHGVTIDEENRFKGIVSAIQSVIPNDSSGAWQSLPTDSNAIADYVDAQTAALKFYGILAQLRITYLRAKERAPTAPKEAIIAAVVMMAKADVSHEDVEKLWDILIKYSDGMKDVTP